MQNCYESALNKLITSSTIVVSDQDLTLFDKLPDEVESFSKRLGEKYYRETFNR